jgi:uncharacterized membrane protein YdbT with pleckstrin-like domain
MVSDKDPFAEIRPSLVLAIKEGVIFLMLLIAFLIFNFNTPEFIFQLNVDLKVLIGLVYVLMGLTVVSFLMLVYKILKLRTTVFTITNEQILYRHGILSVKREYMEIYRVKDFSVFSPFFLRLFALSNLVIHSSDKTHPVLWLYAIKNQKMIYEGLRERVETMRKIKGVREFD